MCRNPKACSTELADRFNHLSPTVLLACLLATAAGLIVECGDLAPLS
jgi:hypothetical protein